MKIMLILLFICIFPIISFANTIISAEYFIDTDPGEGNGTSLSGTFGSSTATASLSGISTSWLSFGTHIVYVRFKDSDNNWGESTAVFLNVGNPNSGVIISAEYFIDTDPGQGNGTFLTGSFGSSTATAYLNDISTTGLDSGLHTIFVRFKDSEDNWGEVGSKTMFHSSGQYALDFDGNDDYVDCGNDDSFDIQDEITIEAWIKADSFTDAHIVSKWKTESDNRGSWVLRVDNGYALFAVSGDGINGEFNATADSVLVLNNYYHLAGIYNVFDNTIRIFVDGIERGTGLGQTGSIYNSNSKVLIGASIYSIGNYHFDGLIEEVRIWKRALSQQEIQERIYRELNMNNPADTTDLVGYWDFNEGIGNVAYDKTQYANNGTLINDPQWVEGYNFHTSVISLLTPTIDETITTSEIIFSWTEVGANHYELIVDNNEGFGSPEIADRHSVFEDIYGTSYELCGNWLSENYYYWKVKGFFANGDSIVSSVSTFTYSPTKLDEPDWVPIYRAYHPGDMDHFYCTADSHLVQANSDGYNYEKTEGYLSLYPFDTTDLVNIFRLYKGSENSIPSENRHYYTTDETDKDNKIIAGWDYEGITGYAFGSPHTELVKMYYVYLDSGNPIVNDNFYTTSEIERNNAFNADYIDWGFLAYVSLSGNLAMRPWNERQPSAGYGINPQNGNFNHYTKTSFSIPSGRMSLDFAHTYNSYSTRLMCPINSLGPGWSHNYSAYIFESDVLIFVFWPGGTIHIYDNSTLEPITLGVYDELIKISDTYEIKKKNQVVYTFEILNPTTDETAFLTSITDRNNNTITCSYIPEAERRLTSVIGPKGRVLIFTYHTEAGKEQLIYQVTDPIGRNIQFEYDNDNNLIQFTDAVGHYTTYSYDTDHREDHLLTQIQLPEDNIITNSYNNKKIISQNIGSTGQFISVDYGYNSVPTATRITDANGIIQDYGYTSEIDGLIQSILTTGSNFTYYYGDTSNPTKPTIITDGNNYDTMIDYDIIGNAESIEKPYSIIHQFEYNVFNDVTNYTDPRGKQYQYGYDSYGNITSINKPAPFGSMSINYNSDGTINQVNDPLSQTSSYYYDQYGSVTSIIDNLGHTTSYDCDDISRLTSKINANNQTTAYSYLNNDLLDTVTNAANITTNYDYDSNDNLTSISTSGQTTSMSYNDMDLVSTISNPLSQQTSFNYYDNGQIQTKIKPDGQTINYAYDNQGKLNNLSGGAINGSLSYDDNNNLVHLSDNNGDIWLNSYDGLNRLLYYTDYYENVVQYTYDDANNIGSITYPDNKTVNYTYYDNNQLNSVTDWNGNTTTYTYRADGTLYQIQNPNGCTTNYDYDNNSRLTNYTTTGPQGLICDYGYVLDAIGNHLSEDITEPYPLPVLLDLNESYSYDNANRIQSAGSASFSHDVNGNMTQRIGFTTTNYTWDVLDRLTDIDINNTNYVYDLFGNRRTATKNGVTTRYVLDINGQMSNILMETDENGNVMNYYIYGLGLVSRIDNNNNTRYYQYDSIGSTIAMTDENGILTHKYSYGPFGQVLEQEEEDDNAFRFVGQFGVMDEENGLYFMRARYFDPEIGRFISEDPIWDVNLYAYAGNNPLINIDPKGLDSMEDDDPLLTGIMSVAGNVSGAGDVINYTVAYFEISKSQKRILDSAKRDIDRLALEVVEGESTLDEAIDYLLNGRRMTFVDPIRKILGTDISESLMKIKLCDRILEILKDKRQ